MPMSSEAIKDEIARTQNLKRDTRPEPTTPIQRLAFRAWGTDFSENGYSGVCHHIYKGNLGGLVRLSASIQKPFSGEYEAVSVSWDELVVEEKSITERFTTRIVRLDIPVNDGVVDEVKVMDAIREATILVRRNQAMLRGLENGKV